MNVKVLIDSSSMYLSNTFIVAEQLRQCRYYNYP